MTGGYREKYYLVEDLDLWLRLSNQTEFANIDEPLLLKREQMSSITLRHQKRSKEVQLALARDFIDSRMIETADEKEIFTWNLKLARCEYYYGSTDSSRL